MAIEKDDRAETDAFLEERLQNTNGLDFLIALDPGGDISGAAGTAGDFLLGFSPPTFDEIMATDLVGPGFVRTEPIQVESS